MLLILATLLLLSFVIPQELLDQMLNWLMPVIIYGVTWAATKAKTLLPGWLILTIVGALSGLATLLTQLVSNPELEWWQQFLYNLLAIVISQLYIQFSTKKMAEDKAISDAGIKK